MRARAHAFLPPSSFIILKPSGGSPAAVACDSIVGLDCVGIIKFINGAVHVLPGWHFGRDGGASGDIRERRAVRGRRYGLPTGNPPHTLDSGDFSTKDREGLGFPTLSPFFRSPSRSFFQGQTIPSSCNMADQYDVEKTKLEQYDSANISSGAVDHVGDQLGEGHLKRQLKNRHSECERGVCRNLRQLTGVPLPCQSR